MEHTILDRLTLAQLPGLGPRGRRALLAHGRLAELRTEAALEVPGVVAVLTAADVPNNTSNVKNELGSIPSVPLKTQCAPNTKAPLIANIPRTSIVGPVAA